MTKKSDLLVVIPAMNEELSIAKTVEDLRMNAGEFDIVVINDGSTDGTERVCHDIGVDVITLPYNLGLEGAFQAGVQFAYRMGYQYVLQFDADGQHRAEYISDMYKKIKQGYDIVIGSRYLDNRKPHNFRMMGSNVIEFVLKLTTGKKIKDPTSGMRMMNRRLIKAFANTINHAPEPDTIAYLMYSKKSKVVEVPVIMEEREFGESYLTISNSIRYMVRMCTSMLIIQWFRKDVII